MRHRIRWTALAVLVALCAGSGQAVAEEPLARIRVSPTVVDWEPLVAGYDRLVLTVTGSCGVVRREFTEGRLPSLNLTDLGDGRDGSYSYELRLVPKVSSEVLGALQTGRKNNDACVVDRLRDDGKLPSVTVQAGSVAVFRGAFVAQDEQEGKSLEAGTAGSDVDGEAATQERTAFAGDRKGGITFATAADQVIPDDLIVQGSACVGFDCVNNENFGFDTIRLKENNLRIKFEDTSVGTFPTNDWQLTANDSASGGLSKFSIDDVTGARTPFTVEAGASNNSIYVDSTGRVGFRTSTPVLDLHVNTSNTPAIRLEQNNSGGFTAQTWDVAANEANFFVRDVTGGSRLPFRIRPGAPTSSLDISATGNVGIGTASPAAKLHVPSGEVRFPPGTAAAAGNNTHFNFSDGKNYIRGTTILADNGGFVGMGGQTNPTHPLHMGSGAHVTAGGVWTNASSRDYKEDIQTLSAADAVATLEGLNPVTYKYKNTANEHHVGFIAEDVPALVAEEDRKSLSPMDVVAVLTKVVQEQQKLVQDQQKVIDELAAKVAELEKSKNAGN